MAADKTRSAGVRPNKADERENRLADLREEGTRLAERFRRAGEERIAKRLLDLMQPRRRRGRPREPTGPFYDLVLDVEVVFLMLEEGISAHAACKRLADPTYLRCVVLESERCVVTFRRWNAHALYERFRQRLRNQGLFISELNGLLRGAGQAFGHGEIIRVPCRRPMREDQARGSILGGN